MYRVSIISKTIIIVFIVSLLSLVTGCQRERSSSEGLEKVVVQLGWIINASYAPIAVAIVNGYYLEEGLEIELRPGGPSGASFLNATHLVAQDSSVDIAVDNAITTFLRAKAMGAKEDNLFKVRLIAAFWQENPMGFLVREDSGLNSLKDLANRKPDGSRFTIGATAGSIVLQPLAKYINVPYEDMSIIQTGADAVPFLAGLVDALLSFWTTQTFEAEIANIPWRFLPINEIPGMSQPAMVVMVSDNTLMNRSEMLEKWLRATIRGVNYTIENPESAARAVLTVGGNLLNIEQEQWIINKSLPLYRNNDFCDMIGYLNATQIMKFVRTLYEFGEIPRMLYVEELIDFSILNRIYEER